MNKVALLINDIWHNSKNNSDFIYYCDWAESKFIFRISNHKQFGFNFKISFNKMIN
jgi:hypothetical protein